MLEGCQITSIVIFTETNHHFGKDGLTGNKNKYDLWYPITILLTEFTFPKTNSSPLKKRSSKRKVVFQTLIFRGDLLVSGEGTTSKKHQQIPKLPESRHSPGLAWPQIQCNYAMEWRNETGIAYKNLCPNNYLKFDHELFGCKNTMMVLFSRPIAKSRSLILCWSSESIPTNLWTAKVRHAASETSGNVQIFLGIVCDGLYFVRLLADNHLSRKWMQRGDVPSINSEIGSITRGPPFLQTYRPHLALSWSKWTTTQAMHAICANCRCLQVQ